MTTRYNVFMKKIFLGLSTLLLFGILALPKSIFANEGVILMRGAGVSGSCFGASVFVDGTYRVLATCRDLKTALSPEQNRYVIWITDEEGKARRLGEIVNGKLSTSIDIKFTELFITAESDGYGNKPLGSVLLSGVVQPINFVTGEIDTKVTITIAPTPTPTKTNAKVTPTKVQGDVTVKTSNQGIGGALTTVLKIALFGFGALLLIVGVFSFISRKRAL